MITDKLRQSIFERDNYTCQYCGRSAYDTDLEIVYLTPELIAQIRTWCDLKGISANSYITALIETDLESKAEKINTFLELRKGL